MTTPLNRDEIIEAVRLWVERLVIGLNLCPFAKRELMKERIRFSVSDAKSEEHLLQDLQHELELLDQDDTIETTLLIHPQVLTDFYDYNQFLDLADDLLLQMQLEGKFQIASFHPRYQFGGTQPNDVENYTNRSPYPMLHLIREDSLEKAIESHPDSDQIPQRNIDLMQDMGPEKLSALLQSCFDDAEAKHNGLT